MTDIQLHRTNAATLELLRHSIERWSAELSTPEARVESYFVEIDFKKVANPDRRRFFNQIPTSLSLDKQQVDDLIAVGRQLLRENAEFQRFLKDLGAGRTK